MRTVSQNIINHSLDGGTPNVKKLFHHVLVKEHMKVVTFKSIKKMI